VARKVAVGHTVLFPTYTAGFFFFMSALEGETMTAAYDRFRDKAAETFISGTCYWPFANAFNFAYVPRAGRILFLNAAGVAWNAYMSHVVSASDDGKSQGGDASVLVASSAEG
jgi:protein Mpv17